MKGLTILLKILTVMTLVIVVLQSCKKEEGNKAPLCEIVSETDAIDISLGALVEINVNAEDPDGTIEEVRFFVNGEGTASANAFPYVFQFESKNYLVGAYIIKATAIDNEGAQTSDELLVNIEITSPTLVTLEATDIDARSATLGGDVTENGGADILERGIVYDTLTNPDTSAFVAKMGNGTGIFSATVENLEPNTTYFVKGYATNSAGIAYGQEVTFKTLERSSGTFTDARDNQEYAWVEIGQQTWMAENLNFETSDGSWAYNDNPVNAETFGLLYNWETAQEVCPAGWHLPSDEEWTTLTNFLGGSVVAGNAMKEKGTNHWYQPNEDATNSSGFTALPGGYRFSNGSFSNRDVEAYFWTSTMLAGSNYALYRRLNHDSGEVKALDDDINQGFSVRCVKD